MEKVNKKYIKTSPIVLNWTDIVTLVSFLIYSLCYIDNHLTWLDAYWTCHSKHISLVTIWFSLVFSYIVAWSEVKQPCATRSIIRIMANFTSIPQWVAYYKKLGMIVLSNITCYCIIRMHGNYSIISAIWNVYYKNIIIYYIHNYIHNYISYINITVTGIHVNHAFLLCNNK